MVFQKLNWVDIVILILLARICYIAVKSGMLTELFKLLGVILSAYLSLHYYVLFSAYFVNRLGLKNINTHFIGLFSFVLLAAAGYLVFLGLRILFVKFIKAESTPGLHRWGGIIVGLARGFLLASLVVFSLAISGSGYFYNSVKDSYSGRYWVNLSCGFYSNLWDNLASKFMTQEKFNKKPAMVQKGLADKK
ncbi:MAG: CvpA family protein [Candidatus Omnitrophica bacterium]|nr:CvpA family protein [Candidatus Omnitrophota bacterium]